MNEQEKIEFERNEIAEIIANSFDHNGEKWDASDFEWSALCVQMAGYRKQVDGEWTGSWDFKCSICNEYNEYATAFCPHCGAHMKGGADEWL